MTDEEINKLHSKLVEILEAYWDQYCEFAFGNRKRFTLAPQILDVVNEIARNLLESWGYEEFGSVSISVSCDYERFGAPVARAITVFRADASLTLSDDGGRVRMGAFHESEKQWQLFEKLLSTLSEILKNGHRLVEIMHKQDGSWYVQFAQPDVVVKRMMRHYNASRVSGNKYAMLEYINMDEVLSDAFDEVMYEVAQNFGVLNAELTIDVVGPLVYGYDCPLEDLPNITFDYFIIAYNGKEQKYRVYWRDNKLYAEQITRNFNLPDGFIETLMAAFQETALTIFNLLIKELQYG